MGAIRHHKNINFLECISAVTISPHPTIFTMKKSLSVAQKKKNQNRLKKINTRNKDTLKVQWNFSWVKSQCSLEAVQVNLKYKENPEANKMSAGNNDQSGHKKALSCCVNNYLYRHAPSLRKRQSILPPWPFTHGYWRTLFLDFCFLPLCVLPALSVSRPHNLISFFDYNNAHSDVTL